MNITEIISIESTAEEGFSTGVYNNTPDNDLTTGVYNTTPQAPAIFEPSITAYWQYYAHFKIFLYVSPILIFGGGIGNVLTILVMQSSAFRSVPSSFILSALAVVDTGVLLTGLMRHWIRYLSNHTLDIRALSDPGCKVHYFFTYFLTHLSPWFLMLLTVERMISVFFPLKCRELCSKKRMVIAVVMVTTVILGFNLHSFFTMRLFTEEYQINENETADYTYCYNHAEFEEFHRGAWYWIDSFLASFVPFLIIFIGNIFIVTKLTAAQKMREGKMQVTANDGNKLTSTTLMLILISICFLLLTMPSCIYFLGIGYNTFPRKTSYDNAKIWFAYTIVNLMFYLNSAINFYLYCLSGSKFRRVLLAMLLCRDSKTTSRQSLTHSTGTVVSKMEMSVTEASRTV